MDDDLLESESSGRAQASWVTIHGFRVQSYGERVSPGFKKALRRLAERGFDDPTCVVVKTASGKRSGITHAGGRYVSPDNAYHTEVMCQMRELGMEPPSPPFIVAPGETTLYHEWGHHVDRTWSGDDQELRFSFRWFSRFYRFRAKPSRMVDARLVESDYAAANAAVLWWHAASELFANLFEDWMRGEKKVRWDECEPESLNRSASDGHPSLRIALLPNVRAKDVRADTYGLFTAGIRSAVELPPVRPGLFGANTDEVVGRLHFVLKMLRAKQP